MSAMTESKLELENCRYRGSGGVSTRSRRAGFGPAFMDSATDTVYLSRFADGRPAPFHTLDGLPEELVLERTTSGRVATVKPSVVSGFVRGRRFYTRDEVAAAVGADRECDQAGTKCSPEVSALGSRRLLRSTRDC